MRRSLAILNLIVQACVIGAALSFAAISLVPKAAGWELVTVLSGSMAPAYPTESVLAVAAVNPADVHVGDVIAFKPEGDRDTVTHRVLAVRQIAKTLEFVTKGDANEDADLRPVPAAALRGRVVFGIPYLGHLVRIVRAPAGFAFLLILPAALLTVREIGSMRAAVRSRQLPFEHSADTQGDIGLPAAELKCDA